MEAAITWVKCPEKAFIVCLCVPGLIFPGDSKIVRFTGYAGYGRHIGAERNENSLKDCFMAPGHQDLESEGRPLSPVHK